MRFTGGREVRLEQCHVRSIIGQAVSTTDAVIPACKDNRDPASCELSKFGADTSVVDIKQE